MRCTIKAIDYDWGWSVSSVNAKMVSDTNSNIEASCFGRFVSPPVGRQSVEILASLSILQFVSSSGYVRNRPKRHAVAIKASDRTFPSAASPQASGTGEARQASCVPPIATLTSSGPRGCSLSLRWRRKPRYPANIKVSKALGNFQV